MKKVSFITIILLLLVQISQAQYLDGIHYRDFHNYYWEPWIDVDTSLCEAGGPKYMSGKAYLYINRSNNMNSIKTREIARYVYTDRPLTVLGVAVLCEVSTNTLSEDFLNDYIYGHVDTNILLPKEDKIAIYKPTPVFDSMIELASSTYSFFHAKPYILSDSSGKTANPDTSLCDTIGPRIYSRWDHGVLFENYPILRFHEGFFDEPVVVSDSFYVAAGMYNSSTLISFETDSGTSSVPNHRYQIYNAAYFLGKESEKHFPFDTKDPFGRHRNKFMNNPGKWSRFSYIEGTRIQDTIDYFDGNPPISNEWQFYIFPIIDTIAYHYTCPVPIHFRAVEQNGDCVVLSWSSHGDHDNWQVIFVPEGASPDTASPALCPSNLYSHCGLEPGVHYRAFVRAQCKERPDSTYFSDWVECGPIYIGMDIDLDIPTMDIERYTTLMPNPASAQVQVFSSFPLRAVEVFDLQGKPVASPAVSDRSVLFDVSGWTPGLYLVSIHTSGGTTVKKLVVE